MGELRKMIENILSNSDKEYWVDDLEREVNRYAAKVVRYAFLDYRKRVDSQNESWRVILNDYIPVIEAIIKNPSKWGISNKVFKDKDE